VFTCQGIGDVSLLLPIILAVAVAKGMGDAFSDSFYDAIIMLKKIPFLHQANFQLSPHPPSLSTPAHLYSRRPAQLVLEGTRRAARA
jgi:hypothetical protein